MKLKFATAAIIILCSTGCVTNTSSYSRDIVYRDGSYYSPADEQYGDYYYEPEPEYSYYEDYSYSGYDSGFYGSPWYGQHDSYRCRFSYRYCANGWNNFFFGFGGLSIIFGNSNYYGSPYSGYHNPYYYYGGHPYYGHHSSRPQPDNSGPIAMPKPGRPIHNRPDTGFVPGPGMRVPGEPVQMPTKPGLVDRNPVEPVIEPNIRDDLNPYTRTRQARQNTRPIIWRNSADDNADNRIIIREGRQPRPIARETDPPRMRARPLPIVDADTYLPADKPIRREPAPQPYPVGGQLNREPRQAPIIRVETRERVERVERPEPVKRVERAAPRRDSEGDENDIE